MLQSPKSWIASATLAAFVAGFAALVLLWHRCSDGGGRFQWLSVTCEAENRPIIIHGDIHRV